MKKIVGLVVLMVLIVSSAFADNNPSTVKNDTESQWFKFKLVVTIEFGKTMCNCCGFGICILDFGIEKNIKGELPYKQAIGEAYFDESGHFVIEIFKQYLNSKTRSVYLDNIFKMDEPFEIPSMILEEFEFDSNYEIKKGEYPIEDNGDILKIRF